MSDTTHVRKATGETAPDGSRVYPLLRTSAGGMAQFELDPGKASRAVVHRNVDEIWLVIAGRGEIWRAQTDGEEVNDDIAVLEPGVCVSITAGTAFQFRNTGGEILRIVAATMPPWPGNDEAVSVPGRWAAVP